MTAAAAHPIAPATRAVRVLTWLLSGALIGFGVVSLLTIGVPLLLAGVMVAILAFRAWGPADRALALMASGASVAPLYVAWLNRFGPGEHCSADRTACSDLANPWPILAGGLCLLLVGPVVLLRDHRRKSVSHTSVA